MSRIWLMLLLCSVNVWASQPDPVMLDNIAALRARAGTQGVMAVKAQAWLDFAQEEFIELDITGVAEDALARAQQLIAWIEQHQAEAAPLPSSLRGVEPVSDVWWQRWEKLRGKPCAAEARARAEVQLHWAGHEQPELGIRHARRHFDEAERALQQGEACQITPPPVSVVVMQPVSAPPVVPVSTPQPVVPTAQVPPPLDRVPNVVHFATDSNRISAETELVLQRVVAVLQAYPQLKLALGGHTDGRGNQAYNLKLSQRRVQAVQQRLLQLGIPADRLETQAFGMRLSNAHDLNRRAQERRVELTILNPQSTLRSETQVRDLQK